MELRALLQNLRDLLGLEKVEEKSAIYHIKINSKVPFNLWQSWPTMHQMQATLVIDKTTRARNSLL